MCIHFLPPPDLSGYHTHLSLMDMVRLYGYFFVTNSPLTLSVDCVVLFVGANTGDLCVCAPEFCQGDPWAAVSDCVEWWWRRWWCGRRFGAALRHLCRLQGAGWTDFGIYHGIPFSVLFGVEAVFSGCFKITINTHTYTYSLYKTVFHAFQKTTCERNALFVSFTFDREVYGSFIYGDEDTLHNPPPNIP